MHLVKNFYGSGRVETQDRLPRCHFGVRLYHGVMKEKFYGKYRIPSSRLAAWDYGRNAAYFVTICTANHAHYFGKITHGEMIPTSLGHAAVDFWNEIPAHFPFVVLDAFVVMPNHVHGIIIIDKSVDTVETHPEMASGQAILRLDYPKRTLKTPITTSGQVAS